MEATIIISAIIIVMGIMILLGKGDWMISGYNTATPEEKAQYNIRRLRLITGIGSIVIATTMILDVIFHLRWLIFAGILPVCFLILVLSNTWVKN